MSQKLHAVVIDDATIIREGIEVILNRNFFPITLNKLSSFPPNLEKVIKSKVDLVMVNANMLWNYNGDIQYFSDVLKSKNIPMLGYNIQHHSQKKLFTSILHLTDSEETICDKIKSITAKNQKGVEEDSSNLSTREIEVIRQIIDGNSNKEIAEKLFISTHTVITHRKNITQKLGIKSISGLTIYAILHGLVEIDEYKTEA
ncbi:LuxR C-terminal-related transcriptional regulator [Halosquirtibacter xylanolyticus]|uniref:response regulator transcription factor n=1 Tax=Halosquirtibacter xylanolyticus TaxID=3374599 RepID=UPI003749C0A5|nr:LuxR C-terminal-related transcriptional regulator [Prolixibacteraceae bacterium]